MSRINLSRIDLNLLVTFEALMDTGSVTLAAERLGRTQSAVSHALARLREQVGDPLLVKVGGRMQPSPFALQLIKDVGPILRQIERVIVPPGDFDPAVTERMFRLAIPNFQMLATEITAAVMRAAPKVDLEWISVSPRTQRDIVEERVDIAILGAGKVIAEGLASWNGPPTARHTFVRRGHPCLREWGMEAWLTYPHVMVSMGGAARQTVQDVVDLDGLRRRIGVRVTEFAAVAPLVAGTDMLATFPPLAIAEAAREHDLVCLTPPIELPAFSLPVVWNARLSKDPAIGWIRDLVIRAYCDADAKAKRIVAEIGSAG